MADSPTREEILNDPEFQALPPQAQQEVLGELFPSPQPTAQFRGPLPLLTKEQYSIENKKRLFPVWTALFGPAGAAALLATPASKAFEFTDFIRKHLSDIGGAGGGGAAAGGFKPGMLMRGAGGAILGGAAGEAGAQLIQQQAFPGEGPTTSGEAATRIAKAGGLQGLYEILGRGIGKGLAALKRSAAIDPALQKWAKERGIDFSAGELTGRGTVAGTEASIAGVPLAQSEAIEFASKRSEAVDAAFRSLQKELAAQTGTPVGVKSPQQISQIVQGATEKLRGTAAEDVLAKQLDVSAALTEKAKQSFSKDTIALAKSLAPDLHVGRGEAKLIGRKSKFNPLNAVRLYRRLGEIIKSAQAKGLDQDVLRLQKLRDAVARDVEGYLSNKNPTALAAWKEMLEAESKFATEFGPRFIKQTTGVGVGEAAPS
ncbi:MAG: hypothetical protein MN733_12435, partial [Nitrososphaera sp.]|nr:hypothetical protein [Nitrososphaera sp.]